MDTNSNKAIDFATIWNKLSSIDCSGHTEKKTTGKDRFGNAIQLTYLSWTWAWGITMQYYPDATYSIREWDGRPYLNDPNAGMLVMTEVDIGGNRRTMWLPVMDGANNAMKEHAYQFDTRNGPRTVAAADMMAINKAIMRCLVKNLAMFGLGLNIYAGEDLPIGSDEKDDVKKAAPAQSTEGAPAPAKKAPAKKAPAKDAQKKAPSSNKAIEAWTAYKSLPAVQKLTDVERNQDWAHMLDETIGKVKSSEITDAEWDKVIERIGAEAKIANGKAA